MLKLWLKLSYNLHRIGVISETTWERMWRFGHRVSAWLCSGRKWEISIEDVKDAGDKVRALGLIKAGNGFGIALWRYAIVLRKKRKE